MTPLSDIQGKSGLSPVWPGVLSFSRLPFSERRRWFLVAMAMPALIYVIAIGVYPLARGIIYSLYEYNLLQARQDAFRRLAELSSISPSTATMRGALLNTTIFTAVGVTIELLLGGALALALWRDDRFNRICLTLILIPVTITPLVVGLIFKGLLLADYGLVGYYLAQSGLTDPRGLFSTPSTALATLIFVDVWEWTPLDGADPARRAESVAWRSARGGGGRRRDADATPALDHPAAHAALDPACAYDAHGRRVPGVRQRVRHDRRRPRQCDQYPDAVGGEGRPQFLQHRPRFGDRECDTDVHGADRDRVHRADPQRRHEDQRAMRRSLALG